MKVEFAKSLITDAMKLQEKTLELIDSNCLSENAINSINCSEQGYYSTQSLTVEMTNGDIFTVSVMKRKGATAVHELYR